MLISDKRDVFDFYTTSVQSLLKHIVFYLLVGSMVHV